MDFSELEMSEGLRWTWDAWPCNSSFSSRGGRMWPGGGGRGTGEEAGLAVPLAIMCCPIASTISDLPVLPYAPLPCRSCRGILNPFARIDLPSKSWACPFCFCRNPFPPSYHSAVSDTSLPAELFPSYTRLDYSLPPPRHAPTAYAVTYPRPSPITTAAASPPSPPPGPAFLFVLDTCLPPDALRALKNAVLQALTFLPDNGLVGLVSFGAQVHVHELGYIEYCPKAIVFDGHRELSSQQIQEFLGISHKRSQRAYSAGSQEEINRFLVRISDTDFGFTTTLEELQTDSVTVNSGHRPQRATGVAVNVAIGLLEGCISITASNILLFVGGPATIGPGMIVGTDFEESMRTHSDLLYNRAPHYHKACKFYKRIEENLVRNGCVFNIFACSLDQVGVYEAKSAVENSGGLIILAETFESDKFKTSLQRLFAQDANGLLKMYYNATIEVITSQKVKVCGALGPCSSLSKKTMLVSDRQVGIGGTSMWKMCSLTDKTHVAFFFEVASQPSAPPGTPFIVQFVTTYQRSDGQTRVRVITTSRRWMDDSRPQDLAAGFDQEAAAAVVSRLTLHKVAMEDITEIIAWLDRLLIQFASKFGDYNKEDAESFRLSSNLSLFPQLIYYLRRSQFLQVRNNTPDETAYYGLMLNREGVVGTVIMIQPTLFSYSLDGPPMPVLLDVSSVKPNCILLFDAFFFIVVHYGSLIAHWRKLEYHKDPCHENFRKLLEAPIMDAQSLLSERNPVPKFIDCDQYSSQARFLLAKLNPSVTHKSEYIGDSDVIFTDDVSLQAFIGHLQELAVKDDYL